MTAGDVRQALRHDPEVRAALERMWPVLTPAQLLHDLFGSPALLRLAGARHPRPTTRSTPCYRPRADDVADVRWTPADVALLDDARDVLGPRHGKGGKIDDGDEIRTYGHIVIDEVQDLTPMQLKMAARRSLNGSLTVVGDLAQATGPLAPDDVGRRARPPARPHAGAGRRAVASATASRPRSWSSPIAVMRAATARPAVADGGARRRRRAGDRARRPTRPSSAPRSPRRSPR